MHWHRNYDSYASRREMRAAFDNWLPDLDADFFVTLAFPQNTRFDRARLRLKNWFARIDTHYLGRAWSRTPSNARTVAIAFPENIRSNLHFHSLLSLPPCARHEPYASVAETFQQHWLSL